MAGRTGATEVLSHPLVSQLGTERLSREETAPGLHGRLGCDTSLGLRAGGGTSAWVPGTRSSPSQPVPRRAEVGAALSVTQTLSFLCLCRSELFSFIPDVLYSTVK